MREVGLTILMLLMSNIFMTFAWYAHLKELSAKPWIVAALASWAVALLEYLFQVPANRIGYTVLSLGQLKILQEGLTLAVFVPFAFFYMKEPLKLDYLWAGLCILGAVFFIYRGGMGATGGSLHPPAHAVTPAKARKSWTGAGRACGRTRAARLLRRQGVEVVGGAVLFEMPALGGRARWEDPAPLLAAAAY